MEQNRYNLSVLLVDDDKDTLHLLEDTLKYFVNHIDIAQNGLEAITKCKEKDFDIVVTDICMPKMNGIEFISQLKKENIDSTIIISSAYSQDTDHINKAINLGVTRFVNKPVSFTLLQKMLEDINTLKEAKQHNTQLTKANTKLEKDTARYLNYIEKKDNIIASQSKNALMGEMFAMITHQLAQPIGAMMMSAGALQFKIDDKINISQDEIKRAVELFTKNSEYLKSTIEGFRLFYKNRNKREINIKKLVENSISLIAPIIKKNSIEVSIDIDHNMTLCTYENELTQVVINIINNAKDVLVENSIKNPKIDIEATATKKYIKIMITDNAGALDSKIESQIFNEHFTTKGDKGTGLGLYMSKLIVEKQLMGYIDAKCEDSKTTFTIEMLNQNSCSV
jgi:signal transduction histidine kinase